MVKHYLIFLALCLELLAALWLIGNPSSISDAMLAFLLHLIASSCFAMGASARFQDTHASTGRFALFCLSLLLPLVGPLLFAILTSDVGRSGQQDTSAWQVINPMESNLSTVNSRHLSTTALSALVKHSPNPETRLDALNKTSKLGPHAARPILQAALDDKSELVRRTAFELLEGRNTSVYFEIGSLLEVMDKNPDSLNDTQVQAEAASQLWELAYQGLADAEAVEGFLQRANAHLHRAMTGNENSPELHFQRGRIRLKLNQAQGAREDFETAMALGQCHDEVLPYLAECAFVEQRYDLILPCLQNLTPIRQHSGRFNKVLDTWAVGV